MSEAAPLRLRPAELADAASIAHIYNQGIEDRAATFETQPRTAAEIVVRIQRDRERFPLMVAERDGQVVAWAGTSLYRPRTCYAGIAEFSVYTERSARGSGVGRTVLTELIRVCAERGFWKLVSRVFPENLASRALCRSLGFREVGVYQSHARLDGEWRDVVIVERLLGEADNRPRHTEP